MPGFRHTVRRPFRVLAAALLLVAVVVATADLALALELAPALLLVGLALVGWMPGEARLVRAMRRRRSVGRARRSSAPAVRPVPRTVAVRGRIGASSVALRGPPRALLT